MSEADFIPLPPASEAGTSTPGPSRPHKNRVNTTLFVSSLPYSATSTDLVTHFSFLGPVRHGFISTDKATGKSKGVGYVTYSLKEDAEQAIKELDNKEFGKGRKIRVAWATEKPGQLERKLKLREIAQNSIPENTGEGTGVGVVVKGKDIQPGNTERERDPDAIRTVILSGLPEVEKNVLWKKVRKVDNSIELKYPIEGEEGKAHLVFNNHNDALKGIVKLHGHVYKGKTLEAVLKKRMEKLKGGAASHAGRLIVRNLAWDTTEEDLKATFLPYGPLNSIDLPKAPSKFPARNGKEAPPRARGFAFVWYLSKSDAEKAIEGANGKPIVRAGQQNQVKGKGKGKEGDERVIAVDWALSKEKWQETQQAEEKVKVEDEIKKEDEDEGDSGSKSSSESGSSPGSDSEGSDDSETSEVEDDFEMKDEDVKMDPIEEAEEEEDVKPTLPTVDVGSTLFIRNLPFETTEQELNQLFRSFGPLRYAKITIDRSTGRSRGTGFVCYWKVEDADKAIEEAEMVHEETGSNSLPLGGKNPFALPSVLTVDPSANLASRLVIHGRALEVTRAVTREQAGQMKEDGERARHAGDKRNTYLMREGVVFPNSPAAQSLSATELESRQNAFNARRTLLRSNPSLYISKTRLSIRQLPLFVTDRGLKRLAIHAIRSFDDEVAQGTREGLSRIEESDDTLSPALAGRDGSSGGKVGKGKKGGKKERETAVIQSKVVRQNEKLDVLLNIGKSKGYGFLEMRSHKDALKVLRWANNNGDVPSLLGGWWIDEMKDIRDRVKKDLESKRKAKSSTDKEGDEENGAAEEKEKIVVEKEGKKVKESLEELDQRYRKLDERVKEYEDGGQKGLGGRGGKTLLIEFSIENIQVVRRRVDKIASSRDEHTAQSDQSRFKGRNGNESGNGNKRKAAEDSDGEEPSESSASRPNRRAQNDRKGRDGRDNKDKRGKEGKRGKGDEGPAKIPSDGAQSAEGREKRGLEKLGDHLGSLIGRKRKQRRIK